MDEKNRKLIHYWRTSLADSDKMGLKLENIKNKASNIAYKDLCGGKVPAGLVTHLFEKAEKDLKRINAWKLRRCSKAEYERLTQVKYLQVVLVPFCADREYQHGKVKSASGVRKVYPLYLVARLDPDGRLSPNKDGIYPWIDRRCLEPSYEVNFYPIIGSVDKVDAFYTEKKLNFLEESLTWTQFFNFAIELMQTVSGSNEEQAFAKVHYSLKKIGSLVPYSDTQGISSTIIQVYDEYIFKESESELNPKLRPLPELLKEFTNTAQKQTVPCLSDKELFLASTSHVAQMHNAYPLSRSQRMSLSYFDKTTDKIFAVNGPPGTGKTTLLLSIIASKWVDAAVHEKPVPIIVASSTNNLAVTNILDQLRKAANPTDGKSQRWLSPVKDYGSYLVSMRSEGRAKEKGYWYQLKRSGSGSLDALYSQEKSSTLQSEFIKAFNQYSGEKFTNVSDCQKSLHAELVSKHKQLVYTIQTIVGVCTLQERLDQASMSLEETEKELARNVEKKAALQTEWEKVELMRKEWLEYKFNDLYWLILFKFVPFVQAKLNYRVQCFADRYPKLFENRSCDYSVIDQEIDACFKRSQSKKEENERHCSSLEELKKEYLELESLKLSLKDQPFFKHSDECLIDPFHPEAYLSRLDTTLRYELFILATHYWEAEWLIQSPRLIEKENNRVDYSREGRLQYWRVNAMLTPCFVTTLHTGPSFFTCKPPSGHFETLSDFVDLLIVDEAAQVMPAIAGAMMSVAKKALLVGDIKQLEPVFQLPEGVDRANAEKFEVCTDHTHYEELKNLGVLSSGDARSCHAYGNVMLIGQRLSSHLLPGEQIRGMWLREHRRCHETIIGYCNELCYNGNLIPLAQSLPSHYPRMGYAHIKGEEKNQGGSRSNLIEAQAIADWLKSHRDEILAMCEVDELGQAVGILTPFAAQAKILKGALNEAGIHRITQVGTIHTLQGAEKPIVIFSSVYTAESKSRSYFFDRAPNMFNVAVSRAKRSFLVFGDMDIFDKRYSNRPSGLLAKYLFASEDNELPDVVHPQFKSIKDRDNLELIDSLDRHRDVLKCSFLESMKTLNIVSPFIRENAIRADAIVELIKQGRPDLEIFIYTDPTLNVTYKEEFDRACQLLREAGAQVKLVDRVHTKAITVDDKLFVLGSFNWLSASRVERYKRHDTSVAYRGCIVADLIHQAMAPIRNKVDTEPCDHASP